VVYRRKARECNLLNKEWLLKKHSVTCSLAVDSEGLTAVIQSVRWHMISRLILMQDIHILCQMFYFCIFVSIIQWNENDRMLGICDEKVPHM
jgi:hypothetical protein